MMSKGLKRFFIVCAIAVGLGLLLSVVGYVTGGVRNLDKMSDRYEWFDVGYANMTYMQLDEGTTFDAIEVKGSVDVVICRGNTEKARLRFDKNYTPPQLEVVDGVLKVSADVGDDHALVNFRFGDSMPLVEIYVPEGKTLRDINIDSDYGDVNIENVSAGNIKIEEDYGDMDFVSVDCVSLRIISDAGDIDAEDLKCGGLYIDSDLGDIDISGEFTGTTEIRSDSGDIELDTALAEALYSVDADVDVGELSIGESEYDYMDKRITVGSGENLIKIVSDCGDVDIGFGR